MVSRATGFTPSCLVMIETLPCCSRNRLVCGGNCFPTPRCLLGIETRTDEYGMRIHPSTPVVANKGPRILCLGDSSTFGWRMDYEDTYPYLLEKALQDSLPGVQVFNGGVPGYTSHQNLHQFMQLVDQVEPDYVILYTGNNDVSLAGSNDLQKFKEAESLIGVQEFLIISFPISI